MGVPAVRVALSPSGPGRGDAPARAAVLGRGRCGPIVCAQSRGAAGSAHLGVPGEARTVGRGRAVGARALALSSSLVVPGASSSERVPRVTRPRQWVPRECQAGAVGVAFSARSCGRSVPLTRICQAGLSPPARPQAFPWAAPAPHQGGPAWCGRLGELSRVRRERLPGRTPRQPSAFPGVGARATPSSPPLCSCLAAGPSAKLRSRQPEQVPPRVSAEHRARRKLEHWQVGPQSEAEEHKVSAKPETPGWPPLPRYCAHCPALAPVQAGRGHGLTSPPIWAP